MRVIWLYVFPCEMCIRETDTHLASVHWHRSARQTGHADELGIVFAGHCRSCAGFKHSLRVCNFLQHRRRSMPSILQFIRELRLDKTDEKKLVEHIKECSVSFSGPSLEDRCSNRVR